MGFVRPWVQGMLAAALVWCCALGPAAAQDAQERRVALVVGNASYRASPLRNPGNDARAVAAALRGLGFEVIEKHDLGREGFASASREFGDRIKGATVALFYFAGHGMQVKGRNFLVPVDADIAREDEVPYRSNDVNEVLDKMDSARTPVNLVLLDACRNNPFARSFRASQVGLAQMDAPAGTLIAFSTAPGSVAQDGEGRNGLYTGALLRHLPARGLPIEQMLKRVRLDVSRDSAQTQIPWESSSLSREFSFAPESRPSPAAATAMPQAVPSELALDLAFWESIKSSANPADHRAYLEQFPAGRFAALARNRIQAAAPPTVPASTTQTAAVAPSPTAGAVVRASSPEGLYVAESSAEGIKFRDVASRSELRSVAVSELGGLSISALTFSPDGRWLLLSGTRGADPVQALMAVDSGQVAWQRQGETATFETASAAVRLSWKGQDARIPLR